MIEARTLIESGWTVRQLCQDNSLVKTRARHDVAHAAGISYGDCGSSWIYDTKIGTGWLNEYYGVQVYPGIWYGTAQIHWYNYSTGDSNYYTDYIYPSDNWEAWDSAHNVYSHPGYIGSVLEAEVITDAGYGCNNYPIAPWAFVWD